MMFVLVLLAALVFLLWLLFKELDKRRELRKQGVWQKPVFSYTVPAGSHTIKVYTYDGRPLEGITLNTLFEVEVIPGDCNMQSIYTKTNWHGKGCLRYQGKPIGFMTDAGPRNEILTRLARKHGAVFVHANIRGYDKHGGWPLISVRVPSTTELKKLR